MNGVIIQARMGSTRLPGKVLMPVLGRPLIEWVCDRAGRAKWVDQVIVATTNLPADDVLEDFCKSASITCFRGSELDVLDRYYQAALKFGLTGVMRVTGDCPLVDPELLDDLFREFETGQWDYIYNNSPTHLPHGLEASVGSFAAFERCWKEARLASEREHVTQYLRKHPEIFRLKSLHYEPDYSRFRITVDHPEDYEVVSEVFRMLDERGQFGYWHEVVSLFTEFPELARKNAHYKIGEGLAKSLERDQFTVRPDEANS